MDGFYPEWLCPPNELILPFQEVHVWRASLEKSAIQLQRLAQTLSSDEKQRAGRFRFQHDRDRFIASRGLLRAILGRYLKTSPAQLQFRYGPYGKPELHQAALPTLQFNLSHSQGLMLCAVTHRRVGVDLEYVRPVSDLNQLTQRFFSAHEHQIIHNLSPDQQPMMFFRYWTCKEALLKAVGDGLMRLGSVEVSLVNSTIEIMRWEGIDQASAHWVLQSFSPASNCAAAVAIEWGDRASIAQASDSLIFFEWPYENSEE